MHTHTHNTHTPVPTVPVPVLMNVVLCSHILQILATCTKAGAFAASVLYFCQSNASKVLVHFVSHSLLYTHTQHT